MKAKRPGRPPKWKKGTVHKHYLLPRDLAEKLKQAVQSGGFQSETEAIYFYVMNAGELDKIAGELARLKRELELKEAEVQALRKRLEIVEQEKAEAQAQAEEWRRKYEELEARLAETFVSLGHNVEEAGEMKGEDLIRELERIDVVELAREYYRLREALHKYDGFFVFLGGERLKRSDAEKKAEELRSKINQVLDLKGAPRPAAWKFINRGDFDKLREVVG